MRDGARREFESPPSPSPLVLVTARIVKVETSRAHVGYTAW